MHGVVSILEKGWAAGILGVPHFTHVVVLIISQLKSKINFTVTQSSTLKSLNLSNRSESNFTDMHDSVVRREERRAEPRGAAALIIIYSQNLAQPLRGREAIKGAQGKEEWKDGRREREPS